MHQKARASSIGLVFHNLMKQIGDPVDFKLPNSFIKMKSKRFHSIKRNIYLTKKMKKSTEDGIFCACISSLGSSGVCGRDCHCGLLYSSCSSGCKCGNDCLNRPFQYRREKKMKKVMTEKCGYGVVTDEDVKKGEFIIEYVGEVIDDKICEERLWKMKNSGEINFYLCEVNRDMVIDATFRGNKSRYMNHSCCPNTEMQKWTIDGETRIGIFATRSIKKGEHLTYDYRFVQFGADQDCFCGAVRCRRKLGVRPSKPKLLSSVAALKLVAYQVYQSHHMGSSKFDRHPDVKRSYCCNCIGQVVMITRSDYSKYFGIIKHFDSKTRRHLVMLEDGNVECMDMSKEEWELCSRCT